MPTGSVSASLLVRNDRANRNSFQAVMNAKNAVTASPGTDSGMTIRQNVPNTPSPSTRPASSSSYGIVSKKLFSIRMQNGIANVA